MEGWKRIEEGLQALLWRVCVSAERVAHPTGDDAARRGGAQATGQQRPALRVSRVLSSYNLHSPDASNVGPPLFLRIADGGADRMVKSAGLAPLPPLQR